MSKGKQLAKLVNSWALRGGTSIAAISLLLMTLLMLVGVGARWLRKPLLYSDEITGYLLATLIFMGFAYVTVNKAHIKVDLLIDRLRPGGARRFIEQLWRALELVYVVALLCALGVETYRLYAGHIYSPSLLVLSWITGIPMLVGLVLLLCQMIVIFADNFKRVKR